MLNQHINPSIEAITLTSIDSRLFTLLASRAFRFGGGPLAALLLFIASTAAPALTLAPMTSLLLLDLFTTNILNISLSLRSRSFFAAAELFSLLF